MDPHLANWPLFSTKNSEGDFLPLSRRIRPIFITKAIRRSFCGKWTLISRIGHFFPRKNSEGDFLPLSRRIRPIFITKAIRRIFCGKWTLISRIGHFFPPKIPKVTFYHFLDELDLFLSQKPSGEFFVGNGPSSRELATF